jgi:amidase
LGGMYHTMFRGYGFGHNAAGVYPTSLIDALSKIAGRENEFPDTFRFALLLFRHMEQQHGGHFYAKAQNLRRRLRAAYDQVLAKSDLLLMPTTPMKTTKIPTPGASFLEVMQHSWGMIGNTAPFDVTGHPSLSVPCRLGEGDRPIGLMLTGRHFDEATLYRAAHAFEQSGDWQKM